MFPHGMGGWWHGRAQAAALEGEDRPGGDLRCHGFGPGHGHGPGGHGGPGGFGHGHGHGHGGGRFGVRRPIRFLAHRLGLDERQLGEVARILDDLRTEHDQGELDERRAASALADAVTADALDAAAVGAAAAGRVATARRLEAAVVRAVGQLHALLDADQRRALALLIRTGAVQL